MIGWLESQCFQAYEATMPAEAHREFRAEVLDRLDEMARPDGASTRCSCGSTCAIVHTETDVTAIVRSTHLDPNRNVRSVSGVLSWYFAPGGMMTPPVDDVLEQIVEDYSVPTHLIRQGPGVLAAYAVHYEVTVQIDATAATRGADRAEGIIPLR